MAKKVYEPQGGQALLSIWREEAMIGNCRENPFTGIESYVCENEDAAMTLANRLADQHPKWKFAIETLRPFF
jgi:hypothetical protein